MKVQNIRLGFATNSSSVHSIVLHKGELIDSISVEGHYGWEEFTLASETAKRQYLATMLFEQLERQLGEEIARTVAQEWSGAYIPQDAYIDHQSRLELPNNPKTGFASQQFFQELIDYYIQPDRAIVGGHDNDGCNVYPDNIRHKMIPKNCTPGLLARKDNNWWVLFNPANGTKVRLSLLDDNTPYTKSIVPELVDVKITDYCDFNCPWCYENSSPSGLHAQLPYLRMLIGQLADAGVFEIALGGGEPTMHPNFLDILNTCSYHGITTNLSTRNPEWLNNKLIVNAIKETVSRVGFSFNRPNYELAKELAASETPWSIHHVLGITPLANLGQMLHFARAFNVPITLLGYKQYGKGANYPYKQAYDGWLDIVSAAQKECSVSVGVDTVLAKEYKDKILNTYNPLSVTFDEGAFSMAVDAVRQVAKPFSYTGKSVPFDQFGELDVLAVFAKTQKLAGL